MDVLGTGPIQVESPAKLNLFLEVLAKRADGFHELETLMTTVTIYDSLYFTTHAEGQIRLTCNWASGMEAQEARSVDVVAGLGDLPQDADNLVWRAVESLRRESGIQAGATIRLVKRIPAMAGLGGASSNAAAALVAANEVWRLGWTRPQLVRLAADLGSDVPFFLTALAGGPQMAIGRGRGERLEALTGMASMHFVIVRPPAGLSTPQVYQNCRPARQAADLQRLVGALRQGNLALVGDCLFNRLQPAAAKLSPWIGKLERVFGQLDCLGHAMSGSGSGYFGICRHARHARRLAALLKAAHVGRVFCARTAAAPCGRAAAAA